MRTQLQRWVGFPFRTRGRALATVLILAGGAAAGWFAWDHFRFEDNLTAAREAMSAHDFEKAHRLLLSCLESRPDDEEVLLLAVKAASRDDRDDAARAHLGRLRDLLGDPTPEVALQSILLDVQLGEVKPHVHTLIEYVEIRHPDREQILEALAKGAVHTYRLKEASFWTKQLLDRFPENPVGRLFEAQALDTAGEHERSIELTRRLVADYPHDIDARRTLAESLLKQRDYPDAEREYRELHSRRPEELAPLLGLIRSLLAQERADEVAPLIDELAERHPDDSEALLARARFALRRDRPSEAEPLLRRAIGAAPHDHSVHLELAVCLERLGRPKESARHAEICRRIEADMVLLEKTFAEVVESVDDPEPRSRAGRICLRNGQAAEAMRWFAGALEIAPGHRETHEAMAAYFAEVGDEVRAEYHRGRLR